MMGSETASGFNSPLPSESMTSLPLSSSSPSIYRIPQTGDPFIFQSSSLVDPPSYADLIFRPTEPQIGATCNLRIATCSSSRSSRSLTLHYLEITVSEPQKEIDPGTSIVTGGGAYVSYLITTRVRGAGNACTVRRRFRDVVALADRLAESYRGYFIPIRPDKNVIEGHVMQKQDFVEQRRDALEKYLVRLAAHPIVGGSEELGAFLRTTVMASRMLDGEVRLPMQLSATQETAHGAKTGRDLLRMFKELKQSVTNDWVGTKPLLVEEDREFVERKGQIQELALQLNATSEQAEALVRTQHETGETMGELGMAFIKLIKLENDEGMYDSQRVGASDAKIVATAAVKASRFYRELNSQSIKHLDTLHEYMGLMLSIRNAFSERSDALLTVQTLLSDLCSLRSRAEKLEAASSRVFGRDESRIQKLEEIRKGMIVTEEAKDLAAREYEKIKENNRNELERFDKERRDDFLNMLRGLAVNQAGYFEKIADVWGGVARETSHYAKDVC